MQNSTMMLARRVVANERSLSTTAIRNAAEQHYKLLVVGGGAGGTTIANKFAGRVGAGNCAIVEPSEDHYYQPGWTLVGGNMKPVEWTKHKTSDFITNKAKWIKNAVKEFRPADNSVVLKDGTQLKYDFLVVALGIQLRFDKIKGLPEAFETPGVCSNYSYKTVQKTYPAFEQFQGGNAIFTFPNTPIKCAGAPQKACYIFEDYLRRSGKRDNAEVYYNTALPVIFGIKKYADVLMELVKRRNIHLNTRHVLTEIKPSSKEAVFDIMNEDAQKVDEKVMKYNLIHVGPPCSAPEALREAPKDFVDQAGFLDVDKHTLQHVNYKNVFGIGDCMNTPNAKTVAAVSAQALTIRQNLKAAMAGKTNMTPSYEGYASCPLVTGYNKCIMAEFGYDGPLETFPVNGAKETRPFFLMKKHFMPFLYEKFLLNGYWEGPKYYRKMMHLGMGK